MLEIEIRKKKIKTNLFHYLNRVKQIANQFIKGFVKIQTIENQAKPNLLSQT